MQSINLERLKLMLVLQDEMNMRVDRDWQMKRRAWWRAIWIECAELMDHYAGWKWWKHGECDAPQALLEIVDIWHFGLSIAIEQHGDSVSDLPAMNSAQAQRPVEAPAPDVSHAADGAATRADATLPGFDVEAAARAIAVELAQPTAFSDVHEAVEHLAAAALVEQRMAFAAVPYLLAAVEADLDTLFAQYVGKNMLNLFRQDHGYREGTYRKLWSGVEDNRHLAEILALPEIRAADDPRRLIRAALEARYAKSG